MLNELILLTIAHVIAVASPGADFAVVLKNTLRGGRASGVATAIGVGSGISVHLVYTLLGIALVLKQSESLFSMIKIIGALYLLWLAWQAFQSRPKTADNELPQSHQEMSFSQAFRQGFLTNVFNPKVTVFFLVLFTSIVSSDTPMIAQVGYGIWLTLYVMLWFSFVAWTFSSGPVRRWYQTHGHYIDWGMGLFLGFIALGLLFN